LLEDDSFEQYFTDTVSQVFPADTENQFFCSNKNANENAKASEKYKPMVSLNVGLVVVSHLNDDKLDFRNYKTEDWPDN
jgi:hypothetical protein